MPENIRLGADGQKVEWMDERLHHGQVRRMWRALKAAPAQTSRDSALLDNTHAGAAAVLD